MPNTETSSSTLERLESDLARRGVTLDGAHREFLKAVPSTVTTTEALPIYGEMAPHARDPRRTPEHFRVSSLLGASELLDSLDGEEADFAFWDEAYLRFGVPIAYSERGDPIVQALAGTSRGAIFLTDHDFFFSWHETWVSGEDLEDVEEILPPGFTDFASMSATQFFDVMSSDAPTDGLFRRLADGFEPFYGELASYYGLAAR